MQTVQEFTCLVDRVSAGGGCGAALIASARCGWVKFRKCGRFMYGRRFSIMLDESVYKNYAWPAILYGSEAW